MDLRGQVVVVTGAGSGIGRATALRFASAGATVIANGRRLDKLEETLTQAAALPGLYRIDRRGYRYRGRRAGGH